MNNTENPITNPQQPSSQAVEPTVPQSDKIIQKPESVSVTGADSHFRKRMIPIFVLLVIGVVAATLLYVRNARPPDQSVVPTPTPTVISTPTPPPNRSRISTTSAFAAFSEEIASFSATLESFSLQDSTLAPPILDLELGL